MYELILLLKQGFEEIVLRGLDPHVCKYTVLVINTCASNSWKAICVAFSG